MKERWIGVWNKLYMGMNHSKLLLCIRSSLIMLIPILVTGSMALMLKSLPIAIYQQFIQSFANGLILHVLNIMYTSTFGVLSLYTTLSISMCYTQQIVQDNKHSLGSVMASIFVFIILSGTFENGINIANWNASGMFTAVVSALLASYLYDYFYTKMKKSIRLFTEGTDEVFRNAMLSLLPTVVVASMAVLFNMLLMVCFDGDNLQMFFSRCTSNIFENMGRNLGTVILFEFLSQFMWFFGIHGNNVLEPVCENIFLPAIDRNQELLAQGLEATEIYSKTFLDTFALMGGSGCVMCLLLAIMIFGKRKSNKNLAKIAIVPGIFNIGELATFGLPIVFNPILFIPYLLTPIVMVLISTVAIQSGIVPIPVNYVEWTTPVLLSGYVATGSIWGSILQLVELLVGVLIYAPFVRIFDKESVRDSKHKMDKLVEIVKKSEETREPVKILELRDYSGMVARHLAEDLEEELILTKPLLYFQPQYNHKHECVGAEALLRWQHNTYGMIYPPLVIQVAEESGKLIALEKNIFQTIMESMPKLVSIFGEKTKISINVTGTTIQSEEFEIFLKDLGQRYEGYKERVVIEITEQAALSIKEELIERLTRISETGFRFAIDDFSMGSTSVKYLQTNLFTLIKLDGSMTKSILENNRSKEIVASITKLSKDLGIDVLAEYVETEEQREMLEEVGCYLYQGYLYSPAVPMEKLKKNEKKM